MSNVCKPGKIDEAKIRYEWAKVHSRPADGKYQCCGRIDKLLLDHCQHKRWRVFCCKSCNIRMGHLMDCVEGMELALQYLKRANERNNHCIDEEAVGG